MAQWHKKRSRERQTRQIMMILQLIVSALVFQALVAETVPFIPSADAVIAKCDPDQYLDTLGLIESRGFTGESHRVHTQDGYILTVHRLRNPCGEEKRRRPVILHHGLLETSRTWLVASPGGYVSEMTEANDTNVATNLGFELGKRCFDVWLANSRGNRYSQEHETLTNKSYQFWDFSYDQMIQYDLTALIDYVLKETDSQSVDYVGHSQGTMIMFGLLASQPQYTRKVNNFIALAPVVRVSHIHTPFRYLANMYQVWALIGRVKGPFFVSTTAKRLVTKLLCNSPIKSLCSNFLFTVSGFSKDNLNLTRIGVYSAEYPGGTSFKNMIHFMQGVRSGEFKRYDYGVRQNLATYGSAQPPMYDLGKIKHPNVHIFSAQNDWLAHLRMSTSFERPWDAT